MFMSNLFNKSDIFDINQAILQLFEAESKEEYLQKFKDILYKPCLEFFKLVLINVFNGTNTVIKEAELTTFKGKKIWVEIKATYLSFSGSEMVNYTLKDITERKFKNQAISLINERMVKGTPQEHLNNLVLALSEAFDISHVFISAPNKELTSSTTLAFSDLKKIKSPVTYDLRKAPCLEIYRQKKFIVHADHLDKIYPDNTDDHDRSSRDNNNMVMTIIIVIVIITICVHEGRTLLIPRLFVSVGPSEAPSPVQLLLKRGASEARSVRLFE